MFAIACPPTLTFVSDMEWGHRFWGRLIGFAYLLPFLYFVSKGYIKDPRLKRNLAVIFALGGFQGALGWYMVKSGLRMRPVDSLHCKYLPLIQRWIQTPMMCPELVSTEPLEKSAGKKKILFGAAIA